MNFYSYLGHNTFVKKRKKGKEKNNPPFDLFFSSSNYPLLFAKSDGLKWLQELSTWTICNLSTTDHITNSLHLMDREGEREREEIEEERKCRSSIHGPCSSSESGIGTGRSW
jgi:hypothetical protein